MANGKAIARDNETAVVQQAHRLADHPIAAWALENGCIVGIASLRHHAIPTPPQQSPVLPSILKNCLAGFMIIEGSIFAQKVLIDSVYSHKPFFSEGCRRQSQAPFATVLRDWLSCNFPTHCFSSVLFGVLLNKVISKDAYNKIVMPRKFRLWAFLMKLAWMRAVADVVFYCVHRALHTRQLYGMFHKRHHEHKNTALTTNFHFTFTDLLLEGFLPIFAALQSLDLFRIEHSALEVNLFATYIQWYEIGSHSGKPMSTVSYFPPLAPLYRLLLGDVDKRNVEFHNDHHVFTDCNYGITQWMDHLVGTVRFSQDEARRLSN